MYTLRDGDTAYREQYQDALESRDVNEIQIMEAAAQEWFAEDWPVIKKVIHSVFDENLYRYLRQKHHDA